MDNSDYAAHYKRERERGAYLVLDNSAHEFKQGQAAADLLEHAVFLNAQEVVVPDCLENGPQTVELAIQTLEMWYEGDTQEMVDLNPALMYVPQGKDEAEWKTCFEELIRLHVFMSKRVKGFRRSFVLGVSKDYDIWDGGLIHLLREYVAPMREKLWQESEIKMQVHMLGWMRYLWHLNAIALEFPWIRSTDSAKPFVYALDGVVTSPNQPIPPYPTRQENYFDLKLTTQGRKRATRNVHIFRKAAAGTLFGTDIVYV